MKKTSLLTTFSLGGILLSANGATLLVDTTIPTTNLLISQSNNGAFTTGTSTATTGATYETARGQTFLMGDTGDSNTQFAVTSITVQHTNVRTYDSSSSLTLWVFKWPTADNANNVTGWNVGASDDGIADGDPFDGTTISTILANGEVSSIASATIANNAYLHFNFASPLLLDENAAYAFVVGFQGLNTEATNQNQFVLRQNSTGATSNIYPDGGMLEMSSTDNGNVNGTKELTFWVQGQVQGVPEPSTALLGGLGLLALLRRRR